MSSVLSFSSSCHACSIHAVLSCYSLCYHAKLWPGRQQLTGPANPTTAGSPPHSALCVWMHWRQPWRTSAWSGRLHQRPVYSGLNRGIISQQRERCMERMGREGRNGVGGLLNELHNNMFSLFALRGSQHSTCLCVRQHPSAENAGRQFIC